DAADAADDPGLGQNAGQRAGDVANVAPAIIEGRKIWRFGDFGRVDDEPGLWKLLMNLLGRLGELETVTDDDVVAVLGILEQRRLALRHGRVFADRHRDVRVLLLRRLDAFGGGRIESAVAHRTRQDKRDLERPFRVDLGER